MKESEIPIPIPIHRLAHLQAYLYEVFTLEDNCRKNFNNTKWYLKESHTDKEVESTIDFFKKIGLKCDCDIINKFDLKEISKETIGYHDKA
jgi:hypothetical protein